MEDILKLYNIFVVDGPSKHQRWHGTSKGEGGFMFCQANSINRHLQINKNNDSVLVQVIKEIDIQ